MVAISKNKKLAPLAQIVKTDENTSTFKFFQLLRYEKTAIKKSILNTVLIMFVKTLTKKKENPARKSIEEMTAQEQADCEYQPNSMSRFLRQLFKVFKDNGIGFVQGDFKGMPNSFYSHLTERFANCLQHKPDYATEAKKAPTWMTDNKDLQEAFEDTKKEYDPEKNYNDNMETLVYKLSRDLSLRSGMEVSPYSKPYLPDFSYSIFFTFYFQSFVLQSHGNFDFATLKSPP